MTAPHIHSKGCVSQIFHLGLSCNLCDLETNIQKVSCFGT